MKFFRPNVVIIIKILIINLYTNNLNDVSSRKTYITVNEAIRLPSNNLFNDVFLFNNFFVPYKRMKSMKKLIKKTMSR